VFLNRLEPQFLDVPLL